MKKRIVALMISTMMLFSSVTVLAQEPAQSLLLATSEAATEAASGEISMQETEGDLKEPSSEETKEDSSEGSTEEGTAEAAEDATSEDTSKEETEDISPEATEDVSAEDTSAEDASSEAASEASSDISSEKVSDKGGISDIFDEEWLRDHNMTLNDEGLLEYVDENGQLWIYDPDDPEFFKYLEEDEKDLIPYIEQGEGAELFGASESGPRPDPYYLPLTGKNYAYPKYYKKANESERAQVRCGLDISSHQGNISENSFRKIKENGIDFVILRAGYRGWGQAGNMKPDTCFANNIVNASNAGLNVGVYFFSQAITTAEAVAEADKCLGIIAPYKSRISLPVFTDYEYSGEPVSEGRLTKAKLSASDHTDIVNAFCKKIYDSGYFTGIYANRNMFMNDMNVSSIPSEYNIWVAQYPSSKDAVQATNYTGRLNAWQFTSSYAGFGKKGKGYISSASVDLDFWYGDYPKATLSFDANGGTGKMEVLKGNPGSKVKVPECSFEKPGCTFKEWNTSKNGKGNRFAPGSDYTLKIKGNKLYAIWEYIPYTLSFDPDGGTLKSTPTAGTGPKTVIYDNKPIGDLPLAEKEGYYFLGWYTDKGEKGDLITAGSVLPSPFNLTVYAHYKMIEPTLLSLDCGNVTLEEGKTTVLSANISPAGVPAFGVQWNSEDEVIAKVTAAEGCSATITAVSAGKTTVTATYRSGETVLTDSCTVTVFSTDYKNETDVDKEGFTVPERLWLADFDGSFTYTGKKITPSFKVYFGESLLRAGTDYSISYRNNVNAGTATVTIRGKGNFAGKCIENFEITPDELSDSDVVIPVGIVNKGKVVKPAVTVTHDGRALKAGKDYTLSYEPVTEKGCAVTVTGKGNYKGVVTKDFVIREKDAVNIGKVSVTGLKKSYTFEDALDTDAIKNGISIFYKKEEIPRSEYELELLNSGAVGKATLVIKPSSDSSFFGQKKLTYNITGNKLGSMILSETSFTYNGCVASPEVSVYTGKKGEGTLLDKDCYNISFNKDRKKAGTVTVTVTGAASKGYTGKLTAKYKINPLSVADGIESRKISVDYAKKVSYEQGGVINVPLVRFTDGNGSIWTLREGLDYTVKYDNNKSCSGARTPSLTITGKGNFAGKSAPKIFTIDKKRIGSLPVSCKNVKENTGKKGSYYYSKPVITDANGKALKEKTDYTVTYVNMATGRPIEKHEVLRAGSYIKAVITATEKNYTGTSSYIYRVEKVPTDIGSVTAEKISNRIYTGKPVKINDLTLKITKKENGKKITETLTEGTDFKITGYYNNVKKGTASLRVEGIGNYSGSRLITFKIVAAPVQISK